MTPFHSPQFLASSKMIRCTFPTLSFFLLLMTWSPSYVRATSFKMDFLSSGVVRTDPLMFSEIGECLSDHVHRFYGSVSNRTMRPDVSYEDMRNATGNTGNVEENKSLYWNPAIYKVVNQNSNKMYQIVDVWFASAYYVWRTGQAKAFPNGLKMKTSDREELARVEASCDGEFVCERTDDGGCQGYGPSNQQQHGFLPMEACSGTLISLLRLLTVVMLLRAGNKHQVPHLLGRSQPGGEGGGEARGVQRRVRREGGQRVRRVL